jgi:hypothetical protein
MKDWVAVFFSEVTGLEEFCDYRTACYQSHLQPVIK